MKKNLWLIGFFILYTATVSAKSIKENEKSEFKPHWFMQVQAGAGETWGESSFKKLISPAAALNFGYQFSPIWGLRFGGSGWQSKGARATPETIYKFKYLQANVDATLDLCNLFGGFSPKRIANPYLFAGVGLNGAFDNNEANALHAAGYNMSYIWSGKKVSPAGRFGLGLNLRITDYVLFNIEANANMLSDKYNSKKADNLDWQFNALAGFTFRFGKNYKKRVAASHVVPASTAKAPLEEPKKEIEEQPVKKEQAPVVTVAPELRENIFFLIRSSEIRSSEKGKITSIVDFLKTNPQAKVNIIGYADVKTGNTSYNANISKKRANSVAAALKKAGIAEDRITIDSKGDTVQPFATPEENRVSICIAR